jgi:hypothetical protein
MKTVLFASIITLAHLSFSCRTRESDSSVKGLELRGSKVFVQPTAERTLKGINCELTSALVTTRGPFWSSSIEKLREQIDFVTKEFYPSVDSPLFGKAEQWLKPSEAFDHDGKPRWTHAVVVTEVDAGTDGHTVKLVVDVRKADGCGSVGSYSGSFTKDDSSIKLFDFNRALVTSMLKIHTF